MNDHTSYYILIAESGYGFLVHEQNDSLYTLQTLVDGLIESVHVKDLGCDLWVNEEGLFRQDFGLNVVASRLADRPLVGPAVLTGYDWNGNTVGVKQERIDWLKSQGLVIDDNDGNGWDAQTMKWLVLN